ncbi:MAG: hypothetical protein WA459_18035 [Stellaceae bacterium]
MYLFPELARRLADTGQLDPVALLGTHLPEFAPSSIPSWTEASCSGHQLRKNTFLVLPNVAFSPTIIKFDNVVALPTERDER